MTNLLTAITTLLLVTNTEIHYPMMTVPAYPPINVGERVVPGLYYSQQVPMPNATNRTMVTTVSELTIISIPELKMSYTNRVRLISEIITPQYVVVEWKDGASETNTFQYLHKKHLTNQLWGWMTNELVITNTGPAYIIMSNPTVWYPKTNWNKP